ncbi:hypothetical protein CDD80_5160 [Ophiocordyceps camponoti-rufipedis]|uniref:Uncharacterized protein n=1 Tax=Ophiocordyceps camponoti-rufipedis TaxID=2004952 RepID=A0A2C5ZMC1_9HYPO|nr:hypothetical protein CDD80_5160 [Ophiocordyceps camponoti-rufipedis]
MPVESEDKTPSYNEMVFAPEDEQDLLERELLSAPFPDGTRLVHRQCLGRWTYNQPLSQLPTDFVPIPITTESEATLRYLGFDEHTAARLWDRWQACSMPEFGCKEFSSFPDLFASTIGTEDCRQYNNTWSEDDGLWYECMDYMGLSTEFQQAIMDPDFRTIRLSQSCYYWVNNTIDMRWNNLLSVRMASLHRASQLEKGSPPQHKSTICRAPLVSPFTAMSKPALKTAHGDSDSLPLFKAVDLNEVESMLNDTGDTLDKSFFDGYSARYAVGDFCDSSGNRHFITDRDVAVMEASYIRRRQMVKSAAVAHITVDLHSLWDLPDDKIYTLYWPREDWKEVVTDSCNYSCPDWAKEASVMIGNMPRKPMDALRAMESGEELSHDDVWKNGAGEDVVQYAFPHASLYDDEEVDFFEDRVEWSLKVFPLTEEEAERIEG